MTPPTSPPPNQIRKNKNKTIVNLPIVEYDKYHKNLNFKGREIISENGREIIDNFLCNAKFRVTIWNSEDQHVVGTSIIDVLFNRSTRGEVIDGFNEIICREVHKHFNNLDHIIGEAYKRLHNLDHSVRYDMFHLFFTKSLMSELRTKGFKTGFVPLINLMTFLVICGIL
ncbi:uncharacterized protein LOC127243986 isoform X2 [Andrographis paniculata]|uniref:uncharacterized protein LOC127243986 isoform X2 n=1 Tax=Andrographis paniculata TaxID=175694 RepID=UPI0021E8D077|nr:uncharacterized protein LOC127243986 isoform X2 [Andrographis paniculata]